MNKNDSHFSRISLNTCTRFLMGVIGFLSVSLATTLEAKTDREIDGLVGPVKTIKVRQTGEESRYAVVWIKEFDLTGKLIKIISGGERDGEMIESTRTTYVHNDRGQKVLAKEFTSKGVNLRNIFYYYDKRGNKTLEISYKTDDSLEQLHVYMYDKRGNLIQKTYYRGGTVVFHEKAIYTYDKKGQRVETTWWENDESKTLQKYDSKGVVIEDLSYRKDGTLVQRRTYRYDTRGNMVESHMVNAEGVVVQRTLTSYQYDTGDNWTKSVSKWLIKDGQPHDEVTLTERTITYY